MLVRCSVYHFAFLPHPCKPFLQCVTPPSGPDHGWSSLDSSVQEYLSPPSTPRRSRLPYTEQEVESLIKGVRKHGHSWTLILNTYKFHPRRTAVDLKDKYRRIQVGIFFLIFQLRVICWEGGSLLFDL